MRIDRFSRAGPPKRPASLRTEAAIPSPGEPADSCEISVAAKEPRSSAVSWLAAVGLGVAALGALSATFGQTGPAVETSLNIEQNFETVKTLAYARGEEAPCGDSVDLLEEYAHTDFGAPVIARIARDAEQAVADGYLTESGDLTDEGLFEDYRPFRISCGAGAQGGPNGIILPASYSTHFRYSGQEIHPLAIVHHEMGHTKYGTPATAEDIVTDDRGSRYSVEHELEIVKTYENPVRERYGYEPRTSYTNHLGETATLP